MPKTYSAVDVFKLGSRLGVSYNRVTWATINLVVRVASLAGLKPYRNPLLSPLLPFPLLCIHG